MTRKFTKLNLQVDDRTSELSDQALYCRSRGHKWTEQAIGIARFRALLALGQTEERNYCENGCGATWTIIYDVRTGEVVANDRKYPKGDYLLPTGSGRLHRSDARVARFARKHPTYA